MAAIGAFTRYTVGRAANIARLQKAAEALTARLQALATAAVRSVPPRAISERP